MTQLDIFTQPARARLTDPSTSHEAAASVSGISRAQALILDILKTYGPMTDDEILRVYLHSEDISPSGCRSRRATLVDMGRVRDSGLRGKTASNRNCVIWKAV